MRYFWLTLAYLVGLLIRLRDWLNAAIGIHDTLVVKGIVTCTVLDGDGEVVRRTVYENMPMNYGLTGMCTWLTGGTITRPSQIELGTGTGTVAATDTALWSATANTLKTAQVQQVYNSNTAEWNATYNPGDPSGTFTEAGLFDTNSNLWAHVVIDESKDDTQSLVVDWQWQLLRSSS